jgi:hypothetical protein
VTPLGTLLLIGAMLVAAPGAAEEPGELAVIVHATRATTMNADDLQRIYLKQRRFWPDGSPIVAVNREDGPLRRAVDRIVGGGDPARLDAYWDNRYFEGVFPPITLASDEAMRRYVASKPNAIGYVDARAVDDSVHVALRLPVQALPTPGP